MCAECGFALTIDNSLYGPFGFGLEHMLSISSKKVMENLLLDVYCLTTVHVSTVWWSIPDASEAREIATATRWDENVWY